MSNVGLGVSFLPHFLEHCRAGLQILCIGKQTFAERGPIAKQLRAFLSFLHRARVMKFIKCPWRRLPLKWQSTRRIESYLKRERKEEIAIRRCEWRVSRPELHKKLPLKAERLSGSTDRMRQWFICMRNVFLERNSRWQDDWSRLYRSELYFSFIFLFFLKRCLSFL